MKPLTPKQHRFVQEYLVDLNATQAAIRSGYSENTASEQGYELLRKPQIEDAIMAAQAKRSERTGITQDMVIQELARVAFFDIGVIFNENGSVRPIGGIDENARRAIAGIDVRAELNSNGEQVANLHKIKIADKLRALELLRRHLKLFTDKLEHTGKNGGPVQWEALRPQLTREEWLRVHGLEGLETSVGNN